MMQLSENSPARGAGCSAGARSQFEVESAPVPSSPSSPSRPRINTDQSKKIERHDRMNIVAIAPLVVLTLMSFCFSGLDVLLTYATFTYTAGDTLYIALIPDCIVSRVRLQTLFVHHISTMTLLLYVILNTEYVQMTKLCTIVEINALILAVQKFLKSKYIQIVFIATWVLLRLVWYPCLIPAFLRKLSQNTAPATGYFQVMASFIILCALNFFWTAEFASGMRKKTESTPSTPVNSARATPDASQCRTGNDAPSSHLPLTNDKSNDLECPKEEEKHTDSTADGA